LTRKADPPPEDGLSPELHALIEEARKVALTPEMHEAQRRSFAYGNVALSNPLVTRALVDDVARTS